MLEGSIGVCVCVLFDNLKGPHPARFLIYVVINVKLRERKERLYYSYLQD